MFVTSDGRPYARFQRALKTGNINLIRTAAADLPGMGLTDALAVCAVMAERDDPAFERSAARWVARYTLEMKAGLQDILAAVALFEAMRSNPAASVAALGALAREKRT